MPIITCKCCGRTTNTATSEWLDCKDNKGLPSPQFARHCYAALEDNKYVKGCIYDQDPDARGHLDLLRVQMAIGLVKGKAAEEEFKAKHFPKG